MRDGKTGQRVDAMKIGLHSRKWEMDSLCSVPKCYCCSQVFTRHFVTIVNKGLSTNLRV